MHGSVPLIMKIYIISYWCDVSVIINHKNKPLYVGIILWLCYSFVLAAGNKTTLHFLTYEILIIIGM